MNQDFNYFEIKEYKHNNQKLYASIKDGHNYVLFSYGVKALEIQERMIRYKLKYSMTTTKHINQAIRFLENQYDCKVIV